MEAEDYLDAGERVLVILTQRGRSKGTGIPVEMRFAQVWTLRDGLGIRMEMYASVEEALESVGLRE
jgi:ketosteroid isomerase-like protein